MFIQEKDIIIMKQALSKKKLVVALLNEFYFFVNKKYPYIDWSFYKSKLRNCFFEIYPIPDSKEPFGGLYTNFNNFTFSIRDDIKNEDELNRIKEVFFHEFFHFISLKKIISLTGETGFLKRTLVSEKGRGLNEGMTHYLTMSILNHLSGIYYFERKVASILINLLSEEVINYYFNSDLDGLLIYAESKGLPSKDLFQIITKLDRYHNWSIKQIDKVEKGKNLDKTNYILDIEKKLIDATKKIILSNIGNCDSEQIELKFKSVMNDFIFLTNPIFHSPSSKASVLFRNSANFDYNEIITYGANTILETRGQLQYLGRRRD